MSFDEVGVVVDDLEAFLFDFGVALLVDEPIFYFLLHELDFFFLLLLDQLVNALLYFP